MATDEPRGMRAVRAWWRKHLKRPLKSHEWGVVFTLWAIALALGVWGFIAQARSSGTGFWIPQTVYQALQFFTFKGGEKFARGPWQLEVARWLAPSVAVYTASKGLVSLFYDQAQLLRASLMRRHVIVCGLSDKGHLIASAFLRRGDQVVIIEKEQARGKLSGCRSEGAVVIARSAHEPEVLRAAGVRRARYVIATCDDATNAEIAVQARALRRKSDGRLECLAHVEQPILMDALGELASRLDDRDRFGIRFFDLFVMGARTMLTECPPFKLLGDSQELVAVGLKAMDAFNLQALRELAKRWAIRVGQGGPPLGLVALDDQTARTLAASLNAEPPLKRLLSVRGVETLGPQENISIVYVLDPDPSAATERALALRNTLPPGTRMVVRYSRDTGLARLLRTDNVGSCAVIDVFPIYEMTCTNPDLLLGAQTDRIARELHWFYSQKLNVEAPDWEHLGESSREATRQQAEWMLRILVDSGFCVEPSASRLTTPFAFTEAEVEGLARVEHARWCVERALDGWVYAKARNDEHKQHNDLLPWSDLTEATRERDRAFVRYWPKLLARPAIGFRVSRHSPEVGNLDRLEPIPSVSV